MKYSKTKIDDQGNFFTSEIPQHNKRRINLF
jgi:hypothetical protein